MNRNSLKWQEPAVAGGWRSKLVGALALVRYNANLVFANKFRHFLLAAVIVFLFIVVVYTLEEEAPPGPAAVFYLLLVPATLLIFYPATYSIQSDVDAGMLETLFGIPDYRYKVWLVRLVVQYLAVLVLLLALAILSRVALADFNVFTMVIQLMFPVVFLGSVAFMIAAVVRSGNATAGIMVAVLLFFWIAEEPLSGSRWNLFHNPFMTKENLDAVLWAQTTLYNRLYIIAGAALAAVTGLLRLQKREKFI
jgi:hypothetical protein